MPSDFITRAPRSVGLVVVLGAWLAATFSLRLGNARTSFLLLGALALLLLAGNQAAFTAGLRMNLTYPLLTLLTNGTYIVGDRYLREERWARKIRALFSSYLSKRVADELIRNPEMAKLGGERREIPGASRMNSNLLKSRYLIAAMFAARRVVTSWKIPLYAFPTMNLLRPRNRSNPRLPGDGQGANVDASKRGRPR